MARNDGVDRVSVRNVNLTRAKVVNAQRHNEREKSAYTNPDIVSERMEMNVHYKAPTDSYQRYQKKYRSSANKWLQSWWLPLMPPRR